MQLEQMKREKEEAIKRAEEANKRAEGPSREWKRSKVRPRGV